MDHGGLVRKHSPLTQVVSILFTPAPPNSPPRQPHFNQPQHPVFSSPDDPTRLSRIVNSSAFVGWIPTVLSKSYLVAPIKMATPNPCVTSPAQGPKQCRPTTRLLSALLTTSLAQTSAPRLQSKFHSRGLYLLPQERMFSSPNLAMASSVEQPMHPYSRGVKTVVGTNLQCMSLVALPKRRAARSLPAMMAVGVSSSRPETTSPMAQTFSAVVVSSSLAMILPFLSVLTPTLSRSRFLVSADLPTANMTVSNSSSISSSFCLQVTTFIPLLFLLMFTGTDFFMNFIPFASMQSPILLASCWSNPRSRIERTITVTSTPRPCRNPAHSSAMQEAPTIRVFPGLFFIQKISSEEMACSRAPGTSVGQVGRPPVATRILLAVTVWTLPYAQVRVMVLGPANLASLLWYSTFSAIRVFLYPKFRDFIWSVILSERASQLFCLLSSPTFQPAPSRSPTCSPSRLAKWNIFLGMQPTLTQVPPSPHLVPAGEGTTQSARPTLAPRAAAALALASPPDPPPMTKQSQCAFSQSIQKLSGNISCT